MINPGWVQGSEPEFDGPGTAVADLLEITPTLSDTTFPNQSSNTLTEIMEQYIKDYAVLMKEKFNYLTNNNIPNNFLIPIDTQRMMIYAPHLRFGLDMALRIAPLTTAQLKDFIGRTDSDLAYLVEHGDLVEKGFIKDGFDLQSDQIKISGNKIIWTPPHQRELQELSTSSQDNVAIPNFYFLSLFIENGEVLRNYLKWLNSQSIAGDINDDKYNKTHYFSGAYYNGSQRCRFKGNNSSNLPELQLTIPELRKFSEGTGEKRIADLMTEIPDFYSNLGNYHDFNEIKNFLYTTLKQHTPQLTV